LPMGQFGHEGFSQVDACEHFFMITADPAAPSPIEGTMTLGQMMGTQPPTFDTVQTDESDTAVILYTSGTTGQPKGAELSHFNMVMNARVSADNVYIKQEAPVHLITLPLFHSFGQTCQMNTGFYQRASLSLLPRFDPDTSLAIMQRDNVSFFAGVPTMYWAILNHPGADKYDLKKIADTLVQAVSGGSALPVEVLKDFKTKFGVNILEGYGLSETSPVATFNHPNMPNKPGSVGTPIWGVEVRVVDPEDNDVAQGEMGEIVIRGHNIMKGYYKRADATAECMRNGWFHSGDIGQFDEDGYLYITDRVKDMIIRGGFNVYPREIEETLMEHPDVVMTAVIGIPHETHGEEIKAYVVTKEGAAEDEDAMRAWCKERLADYKYPREIAFVDTLPMTATGKILKKELRAAEQG